MDKRNEYWDAIKGVAIIAVIMMHATNSTRAFPAESLNYLTGVVTRQFMTFAVPLFFFISGFFVERSFVNQKNKISFHCIY